MTQNDVKKLERQYTDFMLIKDMPVYSFETKKVSLSKAENDGFDSVSQTLYKPDIQDHTLMLAGNFNIEGQYIKTLLNSFLFSSLPSFNNVKLIIFKLSLIPYHVCIQPPHL